MSKPNSDGGWRLPDEIDPPTRIGVCVPVPDAPEHRQAFLGALLQLARWWNWQRDPLKRGREAAEVWMTIWRDVLEQLQEGEGCGAMPFDVRQNEDAPCILEKTQNGVTWTQWADISLCSPNVPVLQAGEEVLVPWDGTFIPIGDLPPDVDTITTSDERRPAGDDPDAARCLAALNAAYVFRRLHIESWRVSFSGGRPANIVIAGILALIGLGLLSASLIPILAASAITSFMLFSNPNLFTSVVERELACIFYNRSSVVNGEVVFDFNQVKSDVAARNIPINIWTWINAYLDIIGANGLNLAGTTTAITQCCANPCTTGTQEIDIDLTVPENQGLAMPITAFNNSTWTWINGTGWRIQSSGSRAEGGIRAVFPINPNSQIVNVFWRFTASHEPYNWFIDVNGATRNVTGYRPFGNFFHGLASPLDRFTGNIVTVLYVHINAANNSSATIDRIRIQYRGCPPV